MSKTGLTLAQAAAEARYRGMSYGAWMAGGYAPLLDHSKKPERQTEQSTEKPRQQKRTKQGQGIKLLDADRAKIIRLAKSGLSRGQIAQETGECYATVCLVLRQSGDAVSVNTLRNKEVRAKMTLETLKPMRDSGMTVAQIAKELGVSKNTVVSYCKRWGC